MNGIKKMFGVLMLLLLVAEIPMVFAQNTDDKALVDSFVNLRHIGNDTYEVTVIVVEAPSKGDLDALREKYRQNLERLGTEQAEAEAFEWIDSFKYDVQFVENATVQIDYRTTGGWSSAQLPNYGEGTGVLKTSEYMISDSGKGIYYKNIEIPKTVYQGNCTGFRATYIEGGPEGIDPTPAHTELCALELNEIDFFANRFGDWVASTLQSNYFLCFGGFLLFGMLLSTLYFSGKTPLTLLDVATPRLPSPKGLAAGGQMIGPFGYTELKEASNKKISAARRVFSKESALMAAGSLRVARISSDVANAMRAKKADAGELAADKDFAKAFSGLSLKSKAATEAELKSMFGGKSFNSFSAEDLKKMGKILNKMEAKLAGDERGLLLLHTMRDFMSTKFSLSQLELTTGAPELRKRGRGHVMAATAAKKLGFGSTRYKLLGPYITGGIDSMVRTARFGKRFVKSTTATVARGVVGKETMESLKKAEGGFGKSAYGFLSTASPTTVVMGTFFPINDKMARMYRTLHDEAHRDMMRYVMKETFAHYGIRITMSETEMMEMMYKDKDVLKMAGFDKLKGSMLREFGQFESQIKAILGDNSLSMQEKLQKVMEISSMHGVTLDRNGLMTSITRLEEIEAMGADDYYGHMKLMELYKFLAEEHGINNPAYQGPEKGKFTFNIGRDSLDASQTWEQYNMRNYMEQLEKGVLTGGIEEILKGSYLNFMNRSTTLMSHVDFDNPEHVAEFKRNMPEYMYKGGFGDFKAIQQRIGGYLKDLMTAEGKEEFAKLHDGKSVKDASLAELTDMLYGKKWLDKKYGVEKRGNVEIEKSGVVQVWEAPNELAAKQSWWKTDMKRHWVMKPDEDYSISEWVHKRFTKSYVAPYKPSIERELYESEGAQTWSPEERVQKSMKLWTRDMMLEDMHNYLNSTAQNAYGTTNESAQFYTKTAAAFLAAALKEKGYDENHADIKYLEKFDAVASPESINRLMDMMKEHNKSYREYLSKPVTYDTLTKSPQAMVMMHEGGFAPYIHGMNLSDYDRVLGGHVAIKDNKGQWRRFDPDAQTVEFGSDARGKSLQEAFNALSQYNEKDPAAWSGFMKEVKDWAGQDYDRQKVMGAVLWRYSMATDNWTSFWNDSNITIRPKHEAAPLAPGIVRFFTGRDLPTDKLTGARNAFLDMGHAVSNITFETAGPLLEGSYGVSPFTELTKQRSWKLAQTVKMADFDQMLKGLSTKDRKELEKYYESAANAHFAYNKVWEFAIDRNPMRASTSFGSRQSWGSYFHYGPRDVISIDSNVRGFMNSGEWATFQAQTWPASLARSVFYPFAAVFRTAQQSMQGNPSKWDYTKSPLRPWEYTKPRIGEFFSSFNVFAHAFENERWQNSAVQRDLSGKRLGAGLKQAPQDIAHVRSGTYATARNGAANPGSSYYDYRYTLHLDPAMAEYIMYRGGTNYATPKGNTSSPGEAARAYFATDNYIKQQATSKLVKREVSGVALALERQREQMGFGLWANPIMGFFSPAFFAWHGGSVFGASNWWASPKEFFTQGVQRFRAARQEHKEGRFNLRQSMLGGMRGTAGGALSAAGRLMRPDLAARQVYCPRCGRGGIRGSACMGCSHAL